MSLFTREMLFIFIFLSPTLFFLRESENDLREWESFIRQILEKMREFKKSAHNAVRKRVRKKAFFLK